MPAHSPCRRAACAPRRTPSASSDAVELARSLDRLPGRLDVYAIEGASFVAGDSLSPSVERAVAALADELSAARRSERR